MTTYKLTAQGDASGPWVAERTMAQSDANVGDFPAIDGVIPVYTYGPSMTLYPVYVRPDMRPWPAPKRLTRRQKRLRGIMKAERRRSGAGVRHRLAFAVALPDGGLAIV